MKKRKLFIIIVIVLIFALGASIKYIYDSTDYQNVLVPETEDENPARAPNDSPNDEKAENEEAPKQEQSLEDEDSYIDDLNTSSNTITLLMLGIDESEDRNIGIYRSDVIVIARMDLDNNWIKVLSIPRDTYAYLPVRDRMDKLGHAYAFGSLNGYGPQASAEALENFLGDIKIDYYFAIKMDPVPGIVDDIGGVKVDVDVNMRDARRGIEINKGEQVLNGDEAMLYIQWRRTPRGDIDRILRVQNFTSSMYKQLRQNNQMVEAARIILNYRSGIETNLTSRHMIALATYFNQLPEGAVAYYTVSGRSRMINGTSYWIANENDEEIDEFLDQEKGAGS